MEVVFWPLVGIEKLPVTCRAFRGREFFRCRCLHFTAQARYPVQVPGMRRKEISRVARTAPS